MKKKTSHENELTRREFISKTSLTGGAIAAAVASDFGISIQAMMPDLNQEKPVHTKVKLKVEKLTPENFRPFGIVLIPDGRDRLPINTYGDKMDLYHDGFESDQPVEWFIANFRPRWNGVLFLERHFQITQTFIPIGGKPFLTVMAPPDCKEENGLPAISEMRAFYVPGDTPIQIYRKTWHENPMALEDLNLLVTAHRTLIKGHIKGGYDKALDALPVDLERRWYKKEGFEISLDYKS
ncbi:MAG: ureidoglycolate lyase [Cyclobacteriaceae bacterium]|jgi:ureidoglycolate lyase